MIRSYAGGMPRLWMSSKSVIRPWNTSKFSLSTSWLTVASNRGHTNANHFIGGNSVALEFIRGLSKSLPKPLRQNNKRSHGDMKDGKKPAAGSSTSNRRSASGLNQFSGTLRKNMDKAGTMVKRSEVEFHNVLRRKLEDVRYRNKKICARALLKRIEYHRSVFTPSSILTAWQLLSRLPDRKGVVDGLVQRMMEITINLAHKRRLDAPSILAVMKACFFLELEIDNTILQPLLTNAVFRLHKFKPRDLNEFYHFGALAQIDIPADMLTIMSYTTGKIISESAVDNHIVCGILNNMFRLGVRADSRFLSDIKNYVLRVQWKPKEIQLFLDCLSEGSIAHLDEDVARHLTKIVQNLGNADSIKDDILSRVSSFKIDEWSYRSPETIVDQNGEEWVEEVDEDIEMAKSRVLLKTL